MRADLQSRRLRRELKTMQHMVDIYCAGNHPTREQAPCIQCIQFLDYAERRLEKCPYGPAKPVCAKCPIHCYKPEPRALAREIMLYAGPRMLLRHPWLSLAHLMDQARRVEHPMTLRRQRKESRPD